MMSVAPVSLRALLGAVALGLVLGGCGGGSTYSYEQGTLAEQFLPTERTVEHHPDSLSALSIEKREGRLQFKLEKDYESLHRKWSCTYQNMGTGRSRRGRSYATLWSLELSLASLQPEFGVTSLSEEQAQRRIQGRRQEYKSTLQIDVFWFEREGNSLLAGPGTRIELDVDGERYQPIRETHGPLREVFIQDRTGRGVYRRNTFYFSRVSDDSTDILKDAQRVELRVDPTGAGSRVRFGWDWEDASQASVRLERREQKSARKRSPRNRGRVAPTILNASGQAGSD